MKYPKIENKSVLITGGAGFIGSNLCRSLLNHNNRVICLDNLSTGKKENIKAFYSHPAFTFIEGDIRNYETCLQASRQVDIILHQAALGSVPRSINDPLATNSVNITGFLNMLQAAKENGVERFIYAASSSTYGDSQELPKVEDRIGKPLSPYAVTKLVNELYAKVFSDLYGIKTIGLRYFNVFGRNQDADGAYAAAIPKFIKAFINHQSPEIYGDGTQTRDFTYIENVIQANHLAATTTNENAVNQVYNVAYGEQYTLNEIVQKIQDLLVQKDKSIATIEVKYSAPRKGDIPHSLASVEKAKKMLNYHPTHSVLQGLEEAIDWYWQYFKKIPSSMSSGKSS